MPTEASMIADLVAHFETQIAFANDVLAPAVAAIQRAREECEIEWEVSTRIVDAPQNCGLYVVAYIHSADQLASAFRALAVEGVRRIKDSKPFDCAETMTRLYHMKHGECFISFHARLVGESCKLVEVGTQPLYEIVCA